MQEYIAIGMSAKPLVMWQEDAANFEGDARTEFVGVEAVADTDGNFRVSSCEFQAIRGLLASFSSSNRTLPVPCRQGL